MTRRPERLKATKLYVSENMTEQPKTSLENHDKLKSQDPSPTRNKQSNSKSFPVKVDHTKEEALSSNTRTTSKLSGTQLPKHETKQISKNPSTHANGQINNDNGVPKGFVTRASMEQILNRRKSINSKSTNSEDKGSTQTMRVLASSDNKTIDNDVLSKGNANPKVPSGFVTSKDMETRIKNTKTKSTKLTPRYQEEQTGDNPKIFPAGMERDPRVKTKHNSNTQLLFSKLEKRQDEQTQQEEVKQLETRLLPKQSKVDDKSNIKRKPPIYVIKKSQDDKASINSKEIDKEKTNPVTDTNSQEKRKSGASVGKSNISVTPRMTSTAIPKAPRINTKDNDKNDSVKILVMNANGRDDKGGTPNERRRHAIQNVVLKHMPNIVLFQEFIWRGITGKIWTKTPIPEHFVYRGHYDASIMYDATCINVKDLPASDILTILAGLQSNANNRLKRTFPMDFNPVARMSISRVTATTKPALDFICISWHGMSNQISGGKMKELKKIEYFEYWMEFLRHIREKYKLPIFAGGDYNVDMYSIEKYVESPFKLCIYEASMRRTVKGIVDFCIVTDDLDFMDISWVNLDQDTSVFHPNEILDHDPIVGSLAVSLQGASDMKLGMGKKKSWPSPIVKAK